MGKMTNFGGKGGEELKHLTREAELQLAEPHFGGGRRRVEGIYLREKGTGEVSTGWKRTKGFMVAQSTC